MLVNEFAVATVETTILERLKPTGVSKVNVEVNPHGAIAPPVHTTWSSPKVPLGPEIVNCCAALALEANNDAATTTVEQNNFLRIETSSVCGLPLAIVTGAIVNNTLVTCDEPSCSRISCKRSEFFYAVKSATTDVENP